MPKLLAAHAQLLGGNFGSSGSDAGPRAVRSRERTLYGDAEVSEDDVSDQSRRAQQVHQFEVSRKQTSWRSPALQFSASSLSEELKHFTDRLESDGTLQRCFEDSKEKAPDFSLETSVAEVKEYLTKFSLERQTWDQLLLKYQKEVPPEETPRGSTETKITEVKVDPMTCLGSSQKEVLHTKPDYQEIVRNQSRVFACMDLVMDELQGSVKQLQAFMDESTQYLQKVSLQLNLSSGYPHSSLVSPFVFQSLQAMVLHPEVSPAVEL
ncbi:hypothetical protein STEG23_005079, partial [Scotinomys teguina]